MRWGAGAAAGVAILAAAGAALAQVSPSFDGVWIMDPDSPSGTDRALRISAGSVIFAMIEADGIGLARGSWHADPAPSADGKVGVSLQITSQVVVDMPDFGEPLAETFHLLPLDANHAEIWRQGETRRWGVLRRTADCDLALRFRQEGEGPRGGCAFTGIDGVAYDGLAGDCGWKAGWEGAMPDGTVGRNPCLVDLPAEMLE